jgi:hypothetical protein
MVDLRTAGGQRQHGRHELLVLTIGDQAMGKVLDLHLALAIALGAQQVAVDGDLAEFIDQQAPAGATGDAAPGRAATWSCRPRGSR